MEREMYRNSNDINDDEYTRMRKAEDSSYEYHGEEADETEEENADERITEYNFKMLS